MLSACEGTRRDQRSCEELAQKRAAGQMERESALLEELERGRSYESELQRKLIAIDAESYRMSVYRECLNRRGKNKEKD